MTTQNREFDIIVFGASGYTGQFVVEKLASVGPREKLTWAIAGRSKRKLEECLAEAEKNVAGKVPDAKQLKNTPIVVCDVDNEESLASMCKRTRVLLNCVGPYVLYGEPVVRACVENGTSHLDVSGEPSFLENMVVKYDRKAEEKGVVVVGACGFDSVPIEAAVQYAEEQFAPGEVNDVEAYLHVRNGPAGYTVNTGTLASLVNSLANWKTLGASRKQLAAYENTKLPEPSFRIRKRGPLHRRAEFRGWSVPFLGSDRSIVYRTQRGLYRQSQHRPIQVIPYVRTGSLVRTLSMFFGMILIYILSSFSFTRKLLMKYPSVFTFGFFSQGGATREQIAQATFSYTLFARGWRSKNPTEVQASPNRQMRVELHGHDCGYVTTAVCMVEAAVSVLKEREKIGRGGVFTIGVATRNTDYLKRIQKDEEGFRFTAKEL